MNQIGYAEGINADRLSDRELATVLAALRWWQRNLPEGITHAFSDYFHDHRPLLAGEIDELCERLNR